MSDAPETRTAVIYARISKNREGDDLKIERQVEACRFLAEKQGLNVSDVLVDDDLSAYKPGVVRPKYAAMCAMIAAGEIHAVVVWAMDRLDRNMKRSAELYELCSKNRVSIIAVQGMGADFSSPGAEFGANLMAAYAQMESQQKSARHILRNEQARSLGMSTGGPTPTGWGIPVEGTKKRDKPLALNPLESELIRTAMTAVLEGRSLSSIAREWNAAGCKTTFDNLWDNVSVRKVLLRPRNAGLVDHKGKILEGVKAQWEPIVDRDTWQAVCQVLANNKTGAKSVARHLLTGLLVCAECGSPMAGTIATARGHTRPIYRCTSGGRAGSVTGPKCRVSINRDSANAEVRSVATIRLSMTSAEALAPTNADAAKAKVFVQERAGFEARVAELEDLYHSQDISVGGYKKQRHALIAEIERCSNALAEIQQRDAVSAVLSEKIGLKDAPMQSAVAVRNKFDAMDLEQKRTVFAALFSKIAVHRAPIFGKKLKAEDRLEFVFTDGTTFEGYWDHYAEGDIAPD